MRLRIAGLHLDVVARSRDLILGVPNAALPFVVERDDAPADLHVDVVWSDLPAPFSLGGALRFDSGGTWRLFDEAGDGVGPGSSRFEFATAPVGERCYRVARLGATLAAGVRVELHRPYYANGRPLYPIDHPLDELLMLQLLAERDGIEVHACGFIDEHGRGHLFVGPSGAGKTTIGALLAGAGAGRVLSDDRVVVRFGPFGPAIHGTFWHGEGELASPETAPLVQIHFLRQSDENRGLSLGVADATARLVSCTFAPFHHESTLALAVDVAARVVAQVPCEELRFRRDPSIASLIRHALR